MKKLFLKYPAVCKECHVKLPAGTEAKYYGRGQIYCAGEHFKGEIVDAKGHIGWVAQTATGEVYQNYKGRCEDAPCCGCCGQSDFAMSEEFDLRHEMRDDNYDY